MPEKNPGGTTKTGPAGLWHLGTAVVIFCAILFTYAPAIKGGFLWDDDQHVTKPDLQSLVGLQRIWFEPGATAQYYPLLHTAFWVEHRWWGNAVVGYHLMNLLLHATAACLVVAVARRLALPGALLAGLIFALHPVCVESVAWITEQKNTLSAVFYLAAALVYLGYDRDRRVSQYCLALGLFVLALLSKTVTATLPAALLVVFWWQRGRLDWRRDVRPLLPWLALGTASGLFTAWIEHNYIGARGSDYALTLVERCLIASRAIWFYLGKLVWPADLMFIYPRWTMDATAGWQYLFPLGVLLLVAGLAWWARRHRGPLAGFLIFAGTLFPALGFFNVFPFIFSFVADHFQYLASLGIIVPLAAGLTLAAGRIPPTLRWLAPAGAGVLLAALGFLTWHQAGLYRDDETLWRETLRRNPTCWLAENNLGALLESVPGRSAEAREHLENAVRLNPTDPYAHLDLGTLLMAQNHVTEGVAHLEEALRVRPSSATMEQKVGQAFVRAGRTDIALAHFARAARLNPRFADAELNWAVALSNTHSLTEAAPHFEKAIALNPGAADPHDSYGCALGTAGQLDEAVIQFEAALRLDPNRADTHMNLRLALHQLGRTAEAEQHYREAVRLNPNLAKSQ